MSNLSEAAADNDDRTESMADETSTPRNGTSNASSPADRKAPFDFRLKLDLGGARSPERGLPLFERRSTQRRTPELTPIAPPEPLRLEPINLSLELLALSEAAAAPIIATSPESPSIVSVKSVDPELQVPTAQIIVAEVPSTTAELSVDTEDATDPTPAVPLRESAMPVLPKPPSRPAPAQEAPSEERVALPQPSRPAAQRRVEVKTVPAHRPRRKRGKGLLVLVVVLGLVGGGGFVFLKQREAAAARLKEWPASLKPLATFVEQTLGHSYTKTVPVATLPQAEYEAKLGILELARVPKDPAGGMSGLRSLGLVSSAPSPAEVGEYVGITRTAFYDPTTATVYQAADSTGPFHDASVIAALSVAMIDQDKKWGAALASLSPSQQLGYLSLIEGAGSFAVRTRTEKDSTFADAYSKELADRIARRDALPTQISPWLVGLFDMPNAESWGLVTRSMHGDFVSALNVPTSDAAVLDSARGLDTPAGAVTTDPSTMGMYLWYGLLYPALGNEFAFRMASAWTGDSVTYSTVEGRTCIRASATSRDAASLTELVNGLNLWAKKRPVDTATTVEAVGTVAVVSACEPAGPSPVDTASHVKADFQGRFVKEQVLLQQLNRLAMPLTAPAIACAVNSYRTDGLAAFDAEYAAVTNDTQGTISASLRQALQDLATFCRAAR